MFYHLGYNAMKSFSRSIDVSEEYVNYICCGEYQANLSVMEAKISSETSL
jgi:hypothetical protein